MHLRVRDLGPLLIEDDGRKQPVVGTKGSAMLAWLAILYPLPGTLAPVRYAALLILLLVTGAADYVAGASLPDRYRRLRLPLTLGAGVAMASGFAWSLMVANSMATQAAH